MIADKRFYRAPPRYSQMTDRFGAAARAQANSPHQPAKSVPSASESEESQTNSSSSTSLVPSSNDQPDSDPKEDAERNNRTALVPTTGDTTIQQVRRSNPQ